MRKTITWIEEFLLQTLKLQTKCPKCGRALLIEPDKFFFSPKMQGHKNGVPISEKSYWGYNCKCGNVIKCQVGITLDDE